MLQFKSAEFYKSISINDQKVFFEKRREVVFVGRSNVGKSSLMNTLFSKKDLVKTSSKPGKTRLANIFLVDKKYFFTDLPGYWFAKLWKNLKDQLDALISWYIEERRQYIVKVMILIDARLGPQESDIAMYQYCSELGIPIAIVLNKIDKITRNDLWKATQDLQKIFTGQPIFLVSTLKKQWIDEIMKYLRETMNELAK